MEDDDSVPMITQRKNDDVPPARPQSTPPQVMAPTDIVLNWMSDDNESVFTWNSYHRHLDMDFTLDDPLLPLLLPDLEPMGVQLMDEEDNSFLFALIFAG